MEKRKHNFLSKFCHIICAPNLTENSISSFQKSLMSQKIIVKICNPSCLSLFMFPPLLNKAHTQGQSLNPQKKRSSPWCQFGEHPRIEQPQKSWPTKHSTKFLKLYLFQDILTVDCFLVYQSIQEILFLFPKPNSYPY